MKYVYNQDLPNFLTVRIFVAIFFVYKSKWIFVCVSSVRGNVYNRDLPNFLTVRMFWCKICLSLNRN